MRPYKLYRHRNFTDVAILVKASVPYADRVSLRVEWYLSNEVRTISIGITDYITIKDIDLCNWNEVV